MDANAIACQVPDDARLPAERHTTGRNVKAGSVSVHGKGRLAAIEER